MIFTNGLASLKKSFLASISQYSSHGRRMFVLPMLGLALTACQGEINVTGDLSNLSGSGNSSLNDGLTSTSASTISGSVGDGPIINAQIKITDSTGAVIGTAVSDTAASYNISVPAGTVYPVVITATGGTDVVTGGAPDFTLVSVAADPYSNTVNVNPFSTLIVKTAQAMSGGLTTANLSAAKVDVLDQLNFGLDPAIVPNPITTPINETNVAAIIKSSEAFGEVIRRTRSTLQVSGVNYSGDEIVDIIAADMTDGVMDGRGSGANTQIAATANIMTGQVLVEALGNQLNVNGTDATTLMDMAINLSVPSATMTTADVLITDEMLMQTKVAVVAAQAHSPSSNLSAIAVVLAGLSGNSLAADVSSSLPANPGNAFNEVVAQVPLSTGNQLELVNASVRSSAVQFADAAPASVPGDRPWENLLNSADLVGYGRNTTGGKGGEVCWVTSLSNSGAGSLRQCAESTAPKWIRFSVSGTINLSAILDMKSNKTIDGRGQDITLNGQGIVIWGQSNVIVHNIKITNPAVDGIRINRGARNVWIDHVTLTGAGDERIDIGDASTDITVSWSKFNGGSSYGILVSGDPKYTGDTVMRVTVHHNHFDRIGDRAPRLRYGKVHSFNNYFDKWVGGYAVGASQKGYLLSENNIFESGTRSTRGIYAEAMGSDPEAPTAVKSVGDWMVNNVVISTLNAQNIFNPNDWYSYANALEAADSSLMSKLVSNSGWQNVPAPQ